MVNHENNSILLKIGKERRGGGGEGGRGGEGEGR
jgi:hypothetical protein